MRLSSTTSSSILNTNSPAGDMSYLTSSTSTLQSIGRIGQGAMRGEAQRQSPHTAFIDILDDDSLLNIFHLYRPAIFDGNEDVGARITGGGGWNRERWWYKLAHVCQRWRKLLLGSASYLGLCLVCTFGTPVAEMLAHSPHLPLIIDFDADRDLTAEDEEGIMLVLEQRDRIRRVRLHILVPNLRKLVMAFDEEYPVLEYLILGPSIQDKNMALMLPETLQAPHLRHLTLEGFVLPMGSRLLTTSTNLITLALAVNHPSTYFQPNLLVQRLSSMPQLETLVIMFLFPIPNSDVGRQLMHTPITTHVTLPNLRSFWFRGVSAYMEAIVRRIATPRLETFSARFFKQLMFSVPRLLQFVNTTENLRFDTARFKFFKEQVAVEFYPRGEVEKYAFSVSVDCWHLDWQVSSVAQIFNSPSQIFSPAEHLVLYHSVHSLSSEEHNEVDRAEWHKLLGLFSNVKTLHVDDGLVEQLSRCLRLEDGEHPLELLPELQELTYSGARDAFKSFIDARQNAGHPVTLIRRR